MLEHLPPIEADSSFPKKKNNEDTEEEKTRRLGELLHSGNTRNIYNAWRLGMYTAPEIDRGFPYIGRAPWKDYFTEGDDKREKLEIEAQRERDLEEIESRMRAGELKVVLKEVETIPEESRESTYEQILNIGFHVESWKNKTLAQGCRSVASLVGEGGATKEFWEELANTFIRDAERAEDQMRTKPNARKAFVSTATLGGIALRYGRIVGDLLGTTATLPARYVMFAGMGLTRISKSAKEARLKKEEVVETSRIDEVERAAEIAFRIYEEAGERIEDRVPSARDLQKSYETNLPKQLLENLSKNPTPGTLTHFFDKAAEWYVKISAERVEKKLKKIDGDHSLSPNARQEKKDAVLATCAQDLTAFDRAMTRYGTLDRIAMGAQFVEEASRGVVKALMIETLGAGIGKLFEASHLSDLFLGHESAASHEMLGRISSHESISHSLHHATQENIPATHEMIHTVPQPEVSPFIETAKHGDSVWKMTERQLEAHFGKEFSHLSAAQRTYIIDAMKRKILEHPDAFGIKNASLIRPGDTMEFSKLFTDKSEVAKVFMKAGALSKSAIASIEEKNISIAQWLQAHPGEALKE